LLPISADARVSGKIGTDWRIGAMSVQMPSSNSAESRVNYSVAAVQRKLFSASSISAIAVSRQPMNKTERDGYNRLLGVDYNLI
ncbi:MAG: hydrolase, partial [Bacteroidia bacterium]